MIVRLSAVIQNAFRRPRRRGTQTHVPEPSGCEWSQCLSSEQQPNPDLPGAREERNDHQTETGGRVGDDRDRWAQVKTQIDMDMHRTKGRGVTSESMSMVERGECRVMG